MRIIRSSRKRIQWMLKERNSRLNQGKARAPVVVNQAGSIPRNLHTFVLIVIFQVIWLGYWIPVLMYSAFLARRRWAPVPCTTCWPVVGPFVVVFVSSVMIICRCRDEVAKVRIVKDMSQLFVSPLTLQGFSSMSELQEHLRRFRSWLFVLNILVDEIGYLAKFLTACALCCVLHPKEWPHDAALWRPP